MITEMHCSNVSKMCWLGSDPLKKKKNVRFVCIRKNAILSKLYTIVVPKARSQVRNGIFCHGKFLVIQGPEIAVRHRLKEREKLKIVILLRTTTIYGLDTIQLTVP